MTNNEPIHPGIRIKAEVFPAKMSVTKAADLMGVRRPALSNLLNGNASLSVDMAMRVFEDIQSEGMMRVAHVGVEQINRRLR